MPTVKNVALAPVDLPTGQLLRVAKTVELTTEQLEHPEVAALFADKALVNVDDAPRLAPPKAPTRRTRKPKEQK